MHINDRFKDSLPTNHTNAEKIYKYNYNKDWVNKQVILTRQIEYKI